MRFIPLFAAMTLLAAAEPRAVVMAPVLNMYAKPTLDSDVVSQAIYATTVSVLEKRTGWIKIKTTVDDYTGWAPAHALGPLKDSESAYAASGRAVTVQSLFAHLYREASVTKHQPLLTVPFETRLEVVDGAVSSGSRWLIVRLPDGRRAFLQNGDVTDVPKILPVPELISLAKRFLGLPYTWGGTSSYGYDCSGFTQMLCRRGGRAIPRDADVQALSGGMSNIEREQLQPGDLLFFGKSLDKITHTGFYLGDGEFIHATTHDKPVIQIGRLYDEPWVALLVASRRWVR